MGKIRGWKKTSFDIVTPSSIVYKKEDKEAFVHVFHSKPLNKWLVYYMKRKGDGSFTSDILHERGFNNKQSAVLHAVSFMKKNP